MIVVVILMIVVFITTIVGDIKEEKADSKQPFKFKDKK